MLPVKLQNLAMQFPYSRFWETWPSLEKLEK